MHEDLTRLATDLIHEWGELSANPKSPFFIASQELREKDIESSREVRVYGNAKTTIEGRSGSKQRKRTKSVSYQDNERILHLMDKF